MLYWYYIFIQVQVKCSLVYMDFEGRSDGRSIKSILAHVAPLKLVWVFFYFLLQLALYYCTCNVVNRKHFVFIINIFFTRFWCTDQPRPLNIWSNTVSKLFVPMYTLLKLRNQLTSHQICVLIRYIRSLIEFYLRPFIL